MAMFYDSEFTKGLGLDEVMTVGYYWVEGKCLRYWSPNSYGGSAQPRGGMPLEDIATALNTQTAAMYRCGESYKRLHRAKDEYFSNHNCYLVEGGPLDGKCVIGLHTLPRELVQVLNVTTTIPVTLPGHDLWELVRGGDNRNAIYLVTEGPYTICDGGLYPLHQKGDKGGRVVCVDTLAYCREIKKHLEGAYVEGKRYMAKLVQSVCREDSNTQY